VTEERIDGARRTVIHVHAHLRQIVAERLNAHGEGLAVDRAERTTVLPVDMRDAVPFDVVVVGRQQNETRGELCEHALLLPGTWTVRR
jgi:hypothetical protein